MMRALLLPALALAASAEPRFSISLPAGAQTVDGRLLLLLSTDPGAEPRFQINDGPSSQIVFGADVENWKPGTSQTVDTKAFGYPIRSLAALKPGQYRVQALLDIYETFRRSDGRVLKLPMDRGEGRQWNRAPGNLYSKPIALKVDANTRANIALDQTIQPIEPPKDTKYIKHIRIQSELLTKFWGRPMHLGAHVLVPEGFDEHPEARYPLAIFHGHYPSNFEGFRTDPPDPDLKPDYSERFKISGYNRIQQQEAYDFYKKWTSPGFPRMLIVEIQHANPFYDDSYAVNSANLGPYGDAIMKELVPEIERRFRGIGQGWARFTYGGSTGGWEALAVQIFYPDDFNGAFAACPDPIDFRAYGVVDIYKDKNAYYLEGAHKRVPRPGKRDYLGHVSGTLEEMNMYELALGTKSRSGQQWDIWEAVYSPAGPDGYPARIFDKLTGAIDPKVAEYWRENYDLRHILERDWAKLGPKVTGKIHLYCGDMDNYYLNNAVYLMEDFLKKAANPPANAEVAYGDRFEHCWNGDPNVPNYISRLRYNTMYVDKILKRIEANHPPGADLKSWRY
jgi:S-formylglutathione hydrolase FrmB